MATENQPTLQVVLGLDPSDREELRTKLARAQDALDSVREGMGDGLPSALWEEVRDEFNSAVANACDVPLTAMLSEAWRQYKPLREYCDIVRYPPGKVSNVPLSTHKVTARQHPFVQASLGEMQLCKVELEAEVSFTFDTAVLVIENGKFKALVTGRSGVEASLSWRDKTLVKRPLGEYTLPGRLSFGEGVAICPDLASLS